MFDLFKRKKQNEIQPILPQINSNEVGVSEYTKPIETHSDILNQDIYVMDKPTRKDVVVPKMDIPRQIESVPELPDLDFETIEVKTRPQTQSGYQVATFADLSLLASKTPIFVFRDKRANTYFGIVEGKIFYLKK